MAGVYLDSSAIVKLAIREDESDALRRHLRRRRPLLSSALARTEVLRAVLPGGAAAIESARNALTRVDLVRVNDRILNLAGTLQPSSLRSLDAIHLATAQHLGPDLGELVTYDERLGTAAGSLGFTVSTPR
jgi:predicted nucleic acid-binding protein